MSYRDWLHCVALGGCVAVLLIVSPLGAQNESDKRSGATPSNDTQNYSAPEMTLWPTGLPTPQWETVVSTDWNEPNCGRAQNSEEADWCEQRRMADATENAVFWTRAGVIVGFVGTAFLVWNLWLVRKSTKAAVDANEINREQFLASERPWIQIDKIELARHVDINEQGIRCELLFQLKNVGNSPAERVWPVVKIYSHRQMNAARNEHTALPHGGSDVIGKTIFPGTADSEESGAQATFTSLGIDGLAQIPAFIACGYVHYKYGAANTWHRTPFICDVYSDDGDPIRLGGAPSLVWAGIKQTSIAGSPT